MLPAFELPSAVQDTQTHGVQEDAYRPSRGWQVVCGTLGLQTATVKMRGPDGISHVSSSIGVGKPATWHFKM